MSRQVSPSLDERLEQCTGLTYLSIEIWMIVLCHTPHIPFILSDPPVPFISFVPFIPLKFGEFYGSQYFQDSITESDMHSALGQVTSYSSSSSRCDIYPIYFIYIPRYLSHRSWRNQHQSKHDSYALPP